MVSWVDEGRGRAEGRGGGPGGARVGGGGECGVVWSVFHAVTVVFAAGLWVKRDCSGCQVTCGFLNEGGLLSECKEGGNVGQQLHCGKGVCV